MNPNRFGIIEDALKIPKILAICHRGTQTKEDTPIDSTHSTKSQGVSAGVGGSSNEGSVKLFEFSQIVQDTDHPENITIIKDTFSEEIRQHSSSSQEAASNRYKYSREVIKPFLKDYSDCNPASDDELIKGVLEIVQKDFPDYLTCFGNNSGSGTGSCESNSKLEKPKRGLKKRIDPAENPAYLCCEKLNLRAEPASASSGGSVFIPVRACEKPEAKPKKKNKIDTTSSLSSCCGKSGDISEKFCNMDKDAKNKSSATKEAPDELYDEPYDPCRKPKCPRKSHCPEAIKPCKKPRIDPKVPPPPFCASDSGPKCNQQLTTGCEDANELKEQAKRKKNACKSSGSSVHVPPVVQPPQQKSVMQAHCEAIDTLKTAASSAMCTVCQVTKETLSLIRTESAKQFEKLKAFGSECEDTGSNSSGKKAAAKKSSTGITKVTNILGPKNIMENLEQLQKVDAEDLLQRMVEKMESTISMISDNVDFDTIANILKSDDNSYDRPRTPPREFVHNLSREKMHATEGPQEIKQDISHTANNMFTAIKSKIFSIFSDINKGVENPECSDEDDDTQ